MHNDFGNAVNEYFVREFRRLYKERKARINALKTPEAVLEYAGLAKKRIREIFDLEKLPRTPLNPQVTGSHAYKYYTKQNIVFALAVKALVLLLSALGMSNMWIAIFSDVGVAVLCILNAMRCLR